MQYYNHSGTPLNLISVIEMLTIAICIRHLVFFREFFRQLLPEAPPPASTPNNSRIPYIRQTTVECFKHVSKRPVARRRINRQPVEGGLVGGAGGCGHSVTAAQQPANDNEQSP